MALARINAPSGLNIRQFPDGPVVRALPHNTLVRVLSTAGAWTEVQTDTAPALKGWTSSKYLTHAVPAAAKTKLTRMDGIERQKVLGRIEYKHAPVPGNRENIIITNGWDKANIIAVTIPQLIGVKGASKTGKVQIHRKVAPQLQALFAAWEKAGLLKHILTWDGTYVPRFIRGSTKTLSYHAHGSAFDVNVAWNGLGKVPAAKGTKGSVRELVPLAETHGFFWGGYFSRLDGMHFEVAKIIKVS